MIKESEHMGDEPNDTTEEHTHPPHIHDHHRHHRLH
jgi:hypothetical protein